MRAGQTLSSHRRLLLGARFLVALFVFMTAGYCILAYIPFSYHWILNGSIASWVRGFGKIHALLYWPIFLVACLTIVPSEESATSRRLAWGFVVLHFCIGVLLLARPLLVDLPNDASSLRWGMISLAPLLWIAAIDYARAPRSLGAEKNHGNLHFTTFLLWAAFLSLLYIAVFFLRLAKTGANPFRPVELTFAIIWSVTSHILLAVLLFALLNMLRGFSNRLPEAAKVEFLFGNALTILLLALTFRYVIFSALSFQGVWANLFSLSVAFCLVAFFSGTSLRMRQPQKEGNNSGLSLTLLPLLTLLPGRRSGLAIRLVYLAVIVILAYRVPEAVAITDWAFLMQKLSVVAIWAISFGFFYANASPASSKRYPFFALFLLAALSFAGYRVAYLARYNLPMLFNQEQLDVNLALEKYNNYEISFKVAQTILHPNIDLFPTAKTDTGSATPAKVFDDSFYEFLHQNTNIPESAQVKAVDVKLVEELSAGKTRPPNIFIFVVDSLRQDYVSPYNKAVSFTPAIEKFAAESIVMRNSFTRYSGTALAEPSIWVGGMILHKQYVQPFYPMNSLQKLLEAENYESIMTVDPVLKIILNPAMPVTELDQNRDWSDYDLCKTLPELEASIEARSDKARPLFVYTQCQDLHITRRTQGFRHAPIMEDNRNYPGFDGYSAARIKAIDTCFGEFIQYLKAHDLYDESIIVLTSDHGDDLGESGRWGHSYYIYPELIRIPLMIHVPQRLLAGMVWNPREVAFSADITPSLYYLLGHRPIIKNPIFGRPLFTLSQKEQSEYLQEDYLVGSSYGAVYGILSQNGRTLYMSDSVTGKDSFYTIADDPRCERNQLTDSIKLKYRTLIHDSIAEINRFYEY